MGTFAGVIGLLTFDLSYPLQAEHSIPLAVINLNMHLIK